jgi:hypothetical protein
VTDGKMSKNRGDTVKRWAVELNKVGGAYLLDSLPPDRLEFVVTQKLCTADST